MVGAAWGAALGLQKTQGGGWPGGSAKWDTCSTSVSVTGAALPRDPRRGPERSVVSVLLLEALPQLLPE